MPSDAQLKYWAYLKGKPTGIVYTDEVKDKIRKARKLQPFTEETRQRLRESHMGKKQTEETIV